MRGKTFATILLILGLISIFYYYKYEKMLNDNSSNYSMINVIENGTINLIDLKNQTDEEGLKNSFKKLLITNTSGKDIYVKLKLEPEKTNTLDILNIRYGIYVNDNLYNIKTMNNTYVIYEGLLHKDEKVDLKVHVWLDALYTGSGEIFSGIFSIECE